MAILADWTVVVNETTTIDFSNPTRFFPFATGGASQSNTNETKALLIIQVRNLTNDIEVLVDSAVIGKLTPTHSTFWSTEMIPFNPANLDAGNKLFFRPFIPNSDQRFDIKSAIIFFHQAD